MSYTEASKAYWRDNHTPEELEQVRKRWYANKRLNIMRANRRYLEAHPEVKFFNAAKQYAKKNGIYFDITKQDIKNILVDTCTYSGKDLTYAIEDVGDKDKACFTRKDRELPYTKENIEIISKTEWFKRKKL